MKKSTRQHLIYAAAMLLVVSAIFYFDNWKIEEARKSLSGEINKLGAEISALQDRNNILSNQLSEISSSLKNKETQIKNLTGELEKVKTESKAQLKELQGRISSLKSQNQDFSAVIEDVIPAVVSIRTDTSSGSGFIVDGEGYIVTNYHVIEGARAATIFTSDGTDHAVRVAGYNRLADIAVLEISGSGFAALSFADSDSVLVGQRVIAVGNPGGLDFTVTQGIVSAVKRFDSPGNEYVQIDVPINPGNSGGPLVDAEGKVIGVTTKKISDFEGVGFALASNQVKNIVDGLIRTDKNR